MFGKKSTQEQMRANNRQLRQAERDVAKTRRDLEKTEKDLEVEIKKLAKQPQKNKDLINILAKQLVQTRAQKARTYKADSRIKGVQVQQKGMQANVKLAGAMGSTAQTMKSMNALLKPEDLARQMKDFEQANAKCEMTEELIDSAMDDFLEDDDQEADDIVNQVLDEIGIEINSKVANAPSAMKGTLASEKAGRETEDRELMEALANLRT